MGNLRVSLFSIPLLMVICVTQAGAQTVQGVVTGSIFDSTGAVVPNAHITLTNEGTNVSQETATTIDGSYRFSLVPPGSYTVSVKAPGFNSRDVKGVVVEASKTVPLSVTLSVASAQEIVEVTAQDVLVQTATSDLATTVNQTAIENIPLLSRNVFDLAFLAPQVQPGMDLSPTSGGARQSGTAYLLNGSDNNDNFSAGGINVTPPLESVAEFTLLTNMMNAQYGRAAGAVVSASQKAGANNFHGVLYEFNRNRSFNASDFFQNRQGSPKPKYIRNQFGGEIDGPIRKNRTFFSFAYDRVSLKRGSELDVHTPTASELAAIRTDAGAIAKYYLDKYPQLAPTGLCPDQAANAPESIGHIGCVHVFNPINTPVNTYFGRIDQNFGEKDRLSFTANIYRSQEDNTYGGGHAYTKSIPSADDAHYHHLALVHTHVFSPGALNELTIAHNRHYSNFIEGDGTTTDPEIVIDGERFGNFGFGIGANEGGLIEGFVQDRWQLQDNFSLTCGSHSFKFGGGFQYGILYRDWDLGAPGQYEFGNTTGKSPADLGVLNKDGTISGIEDLGDSNFQHDFPYFEELSIDPRSGAKASAYRHYTMKDSYFFVNDDWKVSRRLTLNLGLRWEHFGPPTEARGILAQFTNLTCLSIDCTRDARVGPAKSMWPGRYRDFAPRAGFAFDLFGDGRTSLRAGYGISYDRIFDNVWSNGAWNPPFYGLIDWDATGSDTVLYSAPAKPSPSYVANSLPGPAGRVSVRTMDVALKDASVQNFYFGIERQFFQNILLRVNYQGSMGRHLPVLMNLNRYDGMRYNPTFADRRPNSLYTGFNYRANNVSSNYNALVLDIQKRFSKGLQFQFGYTWSKLMDFGSELFTGETTQGQYSQPYYFVSNTRLDFEKGPGAFDHTQTFKVAFTYELPFLKGQQGVPGKVLGGWQVSAFFQGYSGHPVEIFINRTRFRGNALDANGIPENLGGDYNLDGVQNDRPVFVGSTFSSAYSYNNPADGVFKDNSRIGCGFPGARSTNIAACNAQFGVTTPNSLFVNPPGTGARFGSLGRNTFRGPWFNGLDASVFKNFKVTERSKLQIRVEFLNLPNHPNFDGITTDLSSSEFGRAHVLAGSAPSRRLQLGARLTF